MGEETNTTTSTPDNSYGWKAGTNVVGDEGEASYGPLQVSAKGGDYAKYLRRNKKNYDNFKYFLEGIDVTDQNLDQMTPFIPGTARLYFHKTPYFMEKAFPQLTNNFRSYLETGFKEVSGLQNLQGEGIQIEGGWANQSFENVSTVKDDTNEITVTLYEQTGSPVREFIEGWMTGMRDPRSGVAHYHGYVKSPLDGDDDTHVTYCEKNHTGEFVYVVLDPTAQYIEYACLLAHVWPKTSPRDHLNYQSGSKNAAELQLSFSCMKYEGKYINDIAAYYVAKSNLVYNYLEFNPYRNDTDPYATLSENKNSGSKDLDTYMKQSTLHAGTARF